MKSRRKMPPPQAALEKAVNFRKIEEALQEAVNISPATSFVERITRLGDHLSKGDRASAQLLCAELFTTLSTDARAYVVYACALSAVPGAAEQLAAGLAKVARDLSAWLASEAWKTSDTTGDPATAVQERLRVVMGLSLGWSAVGGGEVFEPLLSNEPHGHATAIAAELDAALWSVVSSKAWSDGWHEGKRAESLNRKRALLKEHGERMDAIARDTKAAAEEMPFPSQDGVMVVPRVGAETTTGGKEALAAVKSVVGKALPLVRADFGKVADARASLVAEFPHAVGTVDALLADVQPDVPVRFQPTVILGDPGGGKSRLIRRILDLLGIGWGMLDAATSTDMGIIGSPRRWASGYPSLPILTVERHGIANPAIIVDEVEKAGRSTAGSIHDPLLSLLEQGTARRWRDQFLDTEVDLSHVTWLFTANGLEGVPGPLRNRLRVLRMPRPGQEHVPAIAAQVLRELLLERRIDLRWEPPLDGEEIAAIVVACGEEVSIRDLRRYVAGVLDARSRGATRN